MPEGTVRFAPFIPPEDGAPSPDGTLFIDPKTQRSIEAAAMASFDDVGNPEARPPEDTLERAIERERIVDQLIDRMAAHVKSGAPEAEAVRMQAIDSQHPMLKIWTHSPPHSPLGSATRQIGHSSTVT